MNVVAKRAITINTTQKYIDNGMESGKGRQSFSTIILAANAPTVIATSVMTTPFTRHGRQAA